MSERIWIARSTGNRRGRAMPSPREAALSFFLAWPAARKCDVNEWISDASGLVSRRLTQWSSYRDFPDVTKAQASELPETMEQRA